MAKAPEFPLLVIDVGRLMRTDFDRRAQRFGLTRAQWRVVKRLHREEGLRQRELAEVLEIEPIALGRVIDRLEKSGFVERRADPSDRRAWRLYLAPRAKSIAGAMDELAREAIGDLLHGIKAADLAVASNVLAQAKANLMRLAKDAQEREDDD
ncbi:MAG TPA: MarR family transcriptional regulator [Xanthomonadales bacterium]|nr:MarR family transcriptional regulator [Xanthomonadales bacterium]